MLPRNTYPSCVIELLTMEQQQAECQLEVGITDDGGLTRCFIDIDEFTYKELLAIQPLDGGRVRLSLYTKWDPFRRVHYSTLTRLNGLQAETLYFACSEDFGNKLLQRVETAAVGEAVQPEPIPPKGCKASTVEHGTKRQHTPFNRTGIRVIRAVVVCVLVICFAFRSEGRLFTENAEALSPYTGAASSEGMPVNMPTPDIVTGNQAADVKPAALALATPPAAESNTLDMTTEETALPIELTLAQQPSAAATAAYKEKEVKLAEQLEIGGDKSFFGLPQGSVALSFDDGPSAYTKQIVDILLDEQVAATFLFVGKNALHYPDAVTYTSSHGMQVGNHSWDHSKLTTANREAQKINIAKTNQELERLVGEPITLFRPPYGAINETLSNTVKELKMKVLLWNRDAEDWNAQTPEDILAYIRKVDPSGGLYVLHEDKITVEALPELIHMLKKKQLTFTVFR